eukprot:m.355889 g.355889  ORF g.355889 m.355889 type:complete len:668 (+) comp20740_c0_seq2:427-2430(+)
MKLLLTREMKHGCVQAYLFWLVQLARLSTILVTSHVVSGSDPFDRAAFSLENGSTSVQHGTFGLPVLCPWSDWTISHSPTYSFLHPIHPNKGVQDALRELNMTEDPYLRRSVGVMWCDLLLTKYMKNIMTHGRASHIASNDLLHSYLIGKQVKMDATLEARIDLRGSFILGHHITNCYASTSRQHGRSPTWSTLPITKTDMARVLGEWGDIVADGQHGSVGVTDVSMIDRTVTPRSYKLSVPDECRLAVRYLRETGPCFLKLDNGYGRGAFVLPVRNESFLLPGIAFLHRKEKMAKQFKSVAFRRRETYPLDLHPWTADDTFQLCDAPTDARERLVRLVTLQETIRNPLLIRGKKADLRVYLCLVNTYPFEWYFGGAYFRIANASYDAGDDFTLEQHITTGAVFGANRNVSHRFWSLQTYRDDAIRAGTYASATDFEELFMKKLLALVRYTAKAYTRYMDRAKGSVKLLGMDVMIDDTHEFSVIEINRYPGTHKYNPVQVEIGRHAVRNMVQHALSVYQPSFPRTAPRHPSPTSLFWRSVHTENATALQVLRVGWKRAPADVSCPHGWALPNISHMREVASAVEINSIDVDRGAKLPPVSCTGIRDDGESTATILTRIITQDQGPDESARTDPGVRLHPCTAVEWARGRCRVASCHMVYRLHVCIRT